jgi:hypothetical protein
MHHTYSDYIHREHINTISLETSLKDNFHLALGMNIVSAPGRLLGHANADWAFGHISDEQRPQCDNRTVVDSHPDFLHSTLDDVQRDHKRDNL